MFGIRKKAAPQAPKPKKSPLREWADSILFAVVAATLIRWMTVEAFAIPTPSMESSLMVGDFLFVSKLHYGPRTPKTPLQVPLTHQKLWGTNLPSFSSAIQLPMYRFPGFSHVKNGDVVVFNYPPQLPGEPDYPTDLKTYYVKRCVGIPGDTVVIRNEQVFVNRKAFPVARRQQSSYFVKTTEVLDDRFFRKYDIVNDFKSPEGPFINWQPLETIDNRTKAPVLVGYRVNTSAEVIDQFKTFDWVKGIDPMTAPAGQPEPGIYGGSGNAWNRDNFGPLIIPKKGVTIPINKQTLAVYGPLIQRYEGNKNVALTATSLQINGQPVIAYTFQQDYYFMVGDNRHNSEDSRYWGFVPEDHIVGKAVFVWMSIDPVPADIWHKIRWNRLFRLIE